MPYKPNQVSEEDRSQSYNTMWWAAGSSILSLGNAFFGESGLVFALAWGFTLSGLILAVYSAQTDEFLRGRLEIAMRFAIGALALYLFANWIVNVADIAHSAGYALTSEETQSGSPSFNMFWTDAQTLACAIAFSFYAGYAFAVLRERSGD